MSSASQSPHTPGLTHAICHYHGQWIPGDERGFRSRNHRIHSSGDYREPPPREEHAGLRHYVRSKMPSPPVALAPAQYSIVGQAFLAKLQKMGCRVFALSCGPTHLHVLFVPTDADIVVQLGKAKQFASLKCPGHAGKLWGERCEARAVEARGHAESAFAYILDHARKENAWCWRAELDTPCEG